MYQRDALLKDLRSGVLEVTFNKVSGDLRTMRCTLKNEYLPESYRTSLDEQNQEQTFHQNNPDVLAVWDVQKGGWRSFRVDLVTYAQLMDSY